MFIYNASHLHILIVILTLSGLGFINFSRNLVIKKTTTLLMWSSLIIAAFMAFTNYDPSLSVLTLNHKSGILFSFSALLMIPALLQFHQLTRQSNFHDILFISLLLFFLVGFNNPFIWFLAFEGIFIITGSAFRYYSVPQYRINHILSALVLFTGMILLSTTASHDIAYIFIFFSLLLKFNFPVGIVVRSHNLSNCLYVSVIRVSVTLLLMIKLYPIIQPVQYRIVSIIFIVIGILISLIRFSRVRDQFSFVSLAVDSMYLPLILLASSGLSQIFGVYLLLFIPLIIPFVNQKWSPGDGKIHKGYLLSLMTVHGFPFTAGMIIWIRFIRHILDYPVYNVYAFGGFISLFSFWLYIFRKIMIDAEILINNESKRLNTYLLTILLFNGVVWYYYTPILKFFML